MAPLPELIPMVAGVFRREGFQLQSNLRLATDQQLLDARQWLRAMPRAKALDLGGLAEPDGADPDGLSRWSEVIMLLVRMSRHLEPDQRMTLFAICISLSVRDPRFHEFVSQAS